MIKDLTVLQLKDKRIALNDLIFKAIRNFEEETGCAVESVDTHLDYTFNAQLPITVSVTTRIIV